MKALELLYVSLNVSSLATAENFYTNALGFTRVSPPCPAPSVLVNLLGVQSMQSLMMKRGRQRLELAVLDPLGATYPENSHSDDLWFQHCALVTQDIIGAYHRLCAFDFKPISRDGPQLLPGGISAFKFRDPDGHPLELIQFAYPRDITDGGIDHAAIAVADTDKSIDFYTHHLGLKLQARQTNTGPAQNALDNLANVDVDVVAMAPEIASPHLELLGYVLPERTAVAPIIKTFDLAASRLVIKVDCLAAAQASVPLGTGMSVALLKDLDGHRLLLCTESPSLPL